MVDVIVVVLVLNGCFGYVGLFILKVKKYKM